MYRNKNIHVLFVYPVCISRRLREVVNIYTVTNRFHFIIQERYTYCLIFITHLDSCIVHVDDVVCSYCYDENKQSELLATLTLLGHI